VPIHCTLGGNGVRCQCLLLNSGCGSSRWYGHTIPSSKLAMAPSSAATATERFVSCPMLRGLWA